MIERPDPGRCRSCAAPILWAATRRGKRMPLDAEPHPDGGWFLLGEVAWPIGSAAGPAVRYQAHWATCPHANTWRRSR